jgi:hypothetical protein
MKSRTTETFVLKHRTQNSLLILSSPNNNTWWKPPMKTDNPGFVAFFQISDPAMNLYDDRNTNGSLRA